MHLCAKYVPANLIYLYSVPMSKTKAPGQDKPDYGISAIRIMVRRNMVQKRKQKDMVVWASRKCQLIQGPP